MNTSIRSEAVTQPGQPVDVRMENNLNAGRVPLFAGFVVSRQIHGRPSDIEKPRVCYRRSIAKKFFT